MLMDNDTFKKLYLPYYSKFYRIAYRILENSDDAEDVVQDVYEKLWNIKDDLGKLKSVEAYGVVMTRNISLDRIKAKGRIPLYNRIDTDIECESNYSENGAEEDNKIKIIRTLVKELPINQRRIFYLRYFKNCSPKEISQMTGYGYGNIRVLLLRARERVKEGIKKVEIDS